MFIDVVSALSAVALVLAMVIAVLGAYAAFAQNDPAGPAKHGPALRLRRSRANSNSWARGRLWGRRMCRTIRCRWTTSGWH